jgi:anti-sigma B factor antagonist
MCDQEHPVTWVNGILVVSAPSEIDITNAGQFGQTLSCRIDAGHAVVVVDMSGTTFCDLAGMHQLVLAHDRACAAGGEVRLVIRDAMMLRLLAITGMDQLLPISASLDDALTASPASVIRPRAAPSAAAAAAVFQRPTLPSDNHREAGGSAARQP